MIEAEKAAESGTGGMPLLLKGHASKIDKSKLTIEEKRRAEAREQSDKVRDDIKRRKLGTIECYCLTLPSLTPHCRGSREAPAPARPIQGAGLVSKSVWAVWQ